MYEYFHDEHLISNVQSLHEGVLFWWELDDITELEERAHGKNDPEAKEEYEKYLAENGQLETILRQDYESAHGKLEEIDEYQQALQDKDSDKLKQIIHQYASDIRERKLVWKDKKIIKENKRKDKYRRQLLQEQEERLKKQRTKQSESTSAAATAVRPEVQGHMPFNAKNKTQEPPMPKRPAPIPAGQRVPATPSLLLDMPGLSPRLRLVPENFKNEKGRKDDSYYEKKFFDELRQKSYITMHPTSQYKSSTPEIRRIYDGFENNDYVAKMRQRQGEIRMRGRVDEGLEE
eukprot:4155638-Amphidinium_carterae.1